MASTPDSFFQLPSCDTLLVAVLLGAKCKTDVLSFKDLHRDQNALAIWNDKKTIRRRVYRTWPRNPDGKIIVLVNSRFGKCTSNKIQFWGATLWDFFWVKCIPSAEQLITISTGSKLSKWMIEHNETEHAASEIDWAKDEHAPRQIFPYPIARAIEDQEMRIRLGICGESMPRAAKKKKENQPIAALFRADAYPTPWPLVPFSYEAPKIEQRLPFHMLPKKLVVHDPWGLLSNPEYPSYEIYHDWTSMQDRTHVYKLSLSDSGKKRIESELKAREEKKEQDRLERLERLKKIENIPEGCDGFMLTPIKMVAGPAEPPIFVAHAIAPDPEPVEEAHLYISPGKIIGKGHHSLVLHAEWEVPRSLLVPDVLCYECILEDVQKTLAAADGADGSRKDAQWKEKSGLWEKVVDVKPEITLDMVSKSGSDMGTHVHDHGSSKTSFRYSGPARIVKTSVQWQNAERGPYCSHILKRMHLDERGDFTDTLRPHPLTARVSLVAKLSTGDEHLDTEAANYQDFPEHFFEHWTGYNIVPPLHQPTPVNAVIPQFYGYYVLESPKYRTMSPILLMENCGEQISVYKLNMDDKHECAALLYKFHDARYVHGSVYERNILCQEGPLDRPMYQRGTGEFMEDRRKHVYRLIDFGRSERYKYAGPRMMEESEVGELLKHSYSWYGF